MHIARIESRSLDDSVEAVDLGQSPAEVVFLSFSDSDLAALARAYAKAPAPKPSLRLANLASLRHPYSVDLYLEKVCKPARLIVARILGGADYWRYGVDELAALARARGVALALTPGDHRADPRLEAASTVTREEGETLWRCFSEGGPENMATALAAFARFVGLHPALRVPFSREREKGVAPRPLAANAERLAAAGEGLGVRAVAVPAFGAYARACRAAPADAPRALVVFYRSIYLADDLEPIDALAEALGARGFGVTSVYATSLKDPAALAPLRALLRRERFDVVLNATAFSARLDDESAALDAADAPVLQVVLAGIGETQWRGAQRGLGPADLAMHVALPEIDGRILSRAISFKAAGARDAALEYAPVSHRSLPDRVAHVADLAASWARLRRKAPAERRLACVLPDYPARGGRTGYAVGLDTPASVLAIAETLDAAGYRIESLANSQDLIAALTGGAPEAVFGLDDYVAMLAAAPAAFRESLAVWGAPETDANFADGAFRFRFARLGELIVAVQPDRGAAAARKSEYHDLTRPPRHGYVAFYFWLTRKLGLDALIHLGAHGTLEWLPGKAVALSAECAPEVLLGPTPVVYPFIVNNPGEAAQAKRRIGAVTIGHLTPPLIGAGAHGAALELEGLYDEYSEAQGLDPRRARAIAGLILERGASTGLLREAEAEGRAPEEALARLDAWLCDLKDMRIGDGLHVFGRSPADSADLAGGLMLNEADAETMRARAAACGAAESLALLTALDGRFVAPGPAGAPARGRLDVLPTGRNLYAVDPRSVPTRNAWEIGRRAAEAVVARYAQDHGDWPRRIVLDLWGSASMRTGGDDLAQALALLGVRPTWDMGSNRVAGFEVLPPAMVGRPRVDVTLRISGLFRDVFPSQIALLNDAVRAVAALDEPASDNPLAGLSGVALARVFGAAPGAYGVGLGRTISAGDWSGREELADAYLAATSHAYDGAGEGREAAADFRGAVGRADAFVHAQDLPGQDALDADAMAEHEGGFAAAAWRAGAKPALYHLDSTRPEKTVVRPLGQEIARALRGRAANPRWLAGQMRHGHRGAAEIAQALDNLFAFAALTDAVTSGQFDLLFDATLGDEAVRTFLRQANRDAARHMARKFDEARRRGFWATRRNSSAEILAAMLGEAA